MPRNADHPRHGRSDIAEYLAQRSRNPIACRCCMCTAAASRLSSSATRARKPPISIIAYIHRQLAAVNECRAQSRRSRFSSLDAKNLKSFGTLRLPAFGRTATSVAFRHQHLGAITIVPGESPLITAPRADAAPPRPAGMYIAAIMPPETCAMPPLVMMVISSLRVAFDKKRPKSSAALPSAP